MILFTIISLRLVQGPNSTFTSLVLKFLIAYRNSTISLSKKIRNLDSTSTLIDDGKIRIIADALKDDVALVASLPKDISGRVFKLLGYSDNEAEDIIDLNDLGLF